MEMPSRDRIAEAKAKIETEDEAAYRSWRAHSAVADENSRRSQLPPERPDHVCGLPCDGQDGQNSYCARLRRKLFGSRAARKADGG